MMSKAEVPLEVLSWAGESGPAASSADAALSTLDQNAEHTALDFDPDPDPALLVSRGVEEPPPPPPFTPYVAEFQVSGDEVISHDPHLNEDGEALYRFLLSQAESLPIFLVHCAGYHSESRTRTVTNPGLNGGTSTQTYTETVTDFSFYIGHRVLPQATQWTVGDDEPVYRGRMVRQTGLPGSATKAESAHVEKFKEWSNERRVRGLPPWVGPRDVASREPGYKASTVIRPRETDVLKSSWTLRQWADDYCKSRAKFKEFVYEKVVHGWNLSILHAAIEDAIRSTRYRGRVAINFEVRVNKVVVRPDSRLSRALSKTWLKILLTVTLVYPFILLYQHFNSKGGGRWTVAGGAYALKRWMLPPNGVQPGAVPNLFQTPDGPRILIGVREGEWFRTWEAIIHRSVVNRKIDWTPMYQPDLVRGTPS